MEVSTVGIVILAAGQGKRMRSTTPKVLLPLRSRPLLDYVISAAEKVKGAGQPIVVISPQAFAIQERFGNRVQYAYQEKPLGTGQAVAAAEPLLRGKAATVVVLYGDMPFISSATIQALLTHHQSYRRVLTMATITVPDFSDWRAQFSDFGRLIRDEQGNLVKSVEQKDATPAELAVRELNPCLCCLAASWLWDHLKKIQNRNAQKEYYLTDLVRSAIAEGASVGTLPIDPREAVGVNTPEHLKLAESESAIHP